MKISLKKFAKVLSTFIMLLIVYTFIINNSEICNTIEAYAACSHKYGSWYTEKSATCTTQGVKYKKCSKCNYKYTQKTPALGHSSNGNSYKRITYPTCIVDGKLELVCDRCCTGLGITKPEPAKGHSYGSWQRYVEPKCQTKGKEKRTCSTCKHVETRDVNALGHSSNGNSYKRITYPTCTDEGKLELVCDRCCTGLGITKPEPAKGHSYGSWTVSKAPTCTKNGTRTRNCSTCGKIETVSISATGHSSNGSYTVTKNPTCSSVGYKELRCRRCNVAISSPETIPPTHTIASKTISAPTCIKNGKVKIYCSKCNKTISNITISATGKHSYNSKNQCTICGIIGNGSREDLEDYLVNTVKIDRTTINSGIEYSCYSKEIRSEIDKKCNQLSSINSNVSRLIGDNDLTEAIDKYTGYVSNVNTIADCYLKFQDAECTSVDQMEALINSLKIACEATPLTNTYTKTLDTMSDDLVKIAGYYETKKLDYLVKEIQLNYILSGTTITLDDLANEKTMNNIITYLNNYRNEYYSKNNPVSLSTEQKIAVIAKLVDEAV